MAGNITALPPDIRIESSGKHKEHAEKVNHMVRFNLKQNKFLSVWDEIVDEFISYGPVIAKVTWNPDWIGGKGENRFVGEVDIEHVLKEDFFPDPSIIDIERDKDEGRFYAFRKRVTLQRLAEKYPKFKKYLTPESNEDELVDEGPDPEMTDLFEVYYLGFPEYMPDERTKELRDRADMQEEQGDYYKAEDLRDMALGDVKGLHVAYYANDMLLEYIPYVHDEPTYPFAFKTRYKDPKVQWGYGEIRNIKIPQIMHNKADEIEIEAFAKEGLGGQIYQKGAVAPHQLESIRKNSGKGGQWHEVNDLNGVREKKGVSVPSSIPQYKQHKQQMIETIAQVPPILQGQAPGANMPFRAIAELGSRADNRTKKASNRLRDFLKEIVKLQINLFAQFYTEERYYRYTDDAGETQEGTFRNQEIFDSWARDVSTETVVDPMTGQEVPTTVERIEYFVPDFDISISVMSAKPDDRNYYSQTAFQLYEMGITDAEDILYTLDEGKLPDSQEILSKLKTRDRMKALTDMLQQMPPEAQQMAFESMGQVVEGVMAGVQQAEVMMNGMQKER